VTYWPLRAMLAQLAGVDPEGSPAATRRALEAWLADHAVDDPATVAAPLLATIGAGGAGGSAESDIGEPAEVALAWQAALSAAASDGPVVVVLEDLHWSSDSLLDLLESVVQPQADLPILVIALTRPELLDRRPDWGRLGRNTLSLTLDPLPDADVTTLVEHVLEGVAPEVVAAVVARADGNPFYAGEIARTLVERIGTDLTPERVEEVLRRLPDTVQATVLARLDLLAPRQRRALQVGAVFGRAFTAAGLQALDPDLAVDADETLAQLLDRDLVRRSGAREVAFRHILIREVAYGMLPRAERAHLHAAAARWLATTAAGQADAYAELIAVHAREAATLATALELPEAPALRIDAADRLTAASSVALAAGANVEALRHLQAAIEFAPPERHLDLYERMGETTVHGDTNLEPLMHARELARVSGASAERRLGILSAILTFHTRWQGSVTGRPDAEQLEALFQEGRDLLADVADPLTRARFRAAEAFLPFWFSSSGREATDEELTGADASANEARDLARQVGDAALESAALDALGALAQIRGDFHAMEQTARDRLALGDRLALAERIDAACMVIWADCTTGKLDEGNRLARSVIGTIRPRQATNWTFHLLAWTALSAQLSGEYERVLEVANRAYALWLELGRLNAGYAMRGFLAAFEVARARNDPSITRWAESLEQIMRAFQGRKRERLQRAIVDGNPEAANAGLAGTTVTPIVYEIVERALSFVCDRGQPPDLATLDHVAEHVTDDALMLTAQLHRARGLANRDAGALRRALSMLESAGARPGVARLQVELGRLTGDTALVEAGRQALVALGDVEQADRAAR
jgi:hypothetical protein